MALRLVRQTSDTPNITNKDDTVMTRYAYGGFNGVVKSFGSECEYIAENGVFKVLDGRIVIDGWEIDVDGVGWTLNLSSVSGIQYHSVYAEISVSIESVKIDSYYTANSYPEVEKGDDLTLIQNGTARILLYNVKVENGAITEVNKRFEVIPYLAQKVLDIEERLDALGFREGSITNLHSSVIATQNVLKRQGNYVIGVFSGSITSVQEILSNDYVIFTLPQDFCPKEDFDSIIPMVYSGVLSVSGGLKITTDGQAKIIEGLPLFDYGVELFYITFGFEAQPITN